MKTYEVFTESYSKIIQADGIRAALLRFRDSNPDEVIAITLADRPDLLKRIETQYNN